MLRSLVALTLCVPGLLSAQDETLLGSGNSRIGGFGGPIARVTQMAGEPMVLAGGGGAVLIGRRLAIGGAGFGGTTKVDAVIGGTPTRGELDIGYGGFTIEYIVRSSELVHTTFGALFGGGVASVWPDDQRPRSTSSNEERFAVVEPHVGVEVNVTHWFRLGATVGFRAAFGIEQPQLQNDNLSGANGSLVFRFGSF